MHRLCNNIPTIRLCQAYTETLFQRGGFCYTDGMEHDPAKNENAISLIRQADGNYIGYANKNGKVITVRQGDPHTVLEMLITHP